MTIKLIPATGLALFALSVGVAQGAYYLPFNLAKHEADHFARGVCEDDQYCEAWSNRCARWSPSEVVCRFDTFSSEYGEEWECTQLLHWRAVPGRRRGFYRVVLKRPGEPDCFPVEASN